MTSIIGKHKVKRGDRNYRKESKGKREKWRERERERERKKERGGDKK